MVRRRQIFLPRPALSGGLEEKSASDALPVLLVEAQSSFLASLQSDTLAPLLEDFASLLSDVQASDALTLRISSESASAFASFSTADTLLPSLAESVALDSFTSASDTLLPALAEVSAGMVSSLLADALLLILEEGTDSLLFSSSSDSASVLLDEAAATAAIVQTSDQLLPMLTESSSLLPMTLTARLRTLTGAGL